jgi:hypothetical protein
VCGKPLERTASATLMSSHSLTHAHTHTHTHTHFLCVSDSSVDHVASSRCYQARPALGRRGLFPSLVLRRCAGTVPSHTRANAAAIAACALENRLDSLRARAAVRFSCSTLSNHQPCVSLRCLRRASLYAEHSSAFQWAWLRTLTLHRRVSAPVVRVDTDAGMHRPALRHGQSDLFSHMCGQLWRLQRSEPAKR